MENKEEKMKSIDSSDDSSDDLLSLISYQKEYKKKSMLLKGKQNGDDFVEKEILRKKLDDDSDSGILEIRREKKKEEKSVPTTQSIHDLSDILENKAVSKSIIEDSKMERNLDRDFEVENVVSPTKKRKDSLDSIIKRSDSEDDIVCLDSSPKIEKEKCSSKSGETSSSMIMYSKRILFTYQSPYLNSSVDITEYDKSRLHNGIMLNDSIVNFYLNYSLNQAIEDELVLNAISREEAIDLINNKYEGDSERKTIVTQALDAILRRSYIFSTFFFPLLKGLRKVDNSTMKEKVIKWAYDGHVFDREFILIPIYQYSHFSLAIICYPNKLKEYIKNKMIVNEIDYSRSQRFSGGECGNNSIQDKHPCIVYLDSLGNCGTEECSQIRYLLYVLLENEGIKGVDVSSYNLPQVQVECAQQRNSVDCGVYLISFARKFVQKSSEFSLIGPLNQQKVDDCFKSFGLNEVDPKPIRKQISLIIDELTKKHNTDLFKTEIESDESDIEVVKESIQKKGKLLGSKTEKKTIQEKKEFQKKEYQEKKEFHDRKNEVGKDETKRQMTIRKAREMIKNHFEKHEPSSSSPTIHTTQSSSSGDYDSSKLTMYLSAGIDKNYKLQSLLKSNQKRKSMAISDIKRVNGIDRAKNGYSVKNSL